MVSVLLSGVVRRHRFDRFGLGRVQAV